MDEGVGRRKMNRRRMRRRRMRIRRMRRRRRKDEQEGEGEQKGRRSFGCLSEPLGIYLGRILGASWGAFGVS